MAGRLFMLAAISNFKLQRKEELITTDSMVFFMEVNGVKVKEKQIFART